MLRGTLKWRRKIILIKSITSCEVINYRVETWVSGNFIVFNVFRYSWPLKASRRKSRKHVNLHFKWLFFHIRPLTLRFLYKALLIRVRNYFHISVLIQFCVEIRKCFLLAFSLSSKINCWYAINTDGRLRRNSLQ